MVNVLGYLSLFITSGKLPFYAWIRASILLYLVLPQTQGAKIIYQNHLEPFLTEHENEIEDFISSAHDRAKRAGLEYLKRGIDVIKEYVFGMKIKKGQRTSTSEPSKSPSTGGSYTQNLLARFYLPTATPAAGRVQTVSVPIPTSGDIYGLISGVLGGKQTPSTSTMGQDQSASAGPLASGEERMNYISIQRGRLRGLLQALDQEASKIPSGSSSRSEEIKTQQATQVPLPETPGDERTPTMTMRKNRSEMDFENVEREDFGEEKRSSGAAGGWMPWNWNASPSPSPSSSSKGKRGGGGGVETETERARSTGMDVG
ncbi:MAG: hypothetical protein M1823_001275 [Watsoniomyces obsoletus]|nr:MAG: hypothetical protein M1823_001275 [Watsoniomyces obsoletus]